MVSFGSDWYYSDIGMEPPMVGGLGWSHRDYQEVGWGEGGAQLGYGDGDETTIIGDTALTAYFRHHFDVIDASIFDNIDLQLVYDDGAIVYLNGSEIWRVNMPEGMVGYDTLAAGSSGDNALATINLASSLVDGDNVLAVEVHQRSAGSSDISFDGKLVANPLGLVSVSRGPYLQKLADTSITIKWRTSTATESVVNYGLVSSQLDYSLSDNMLKVDHEIQINGLTANQRYYYEIANQTTTLIAAAPTLYFQSAPTIGTRQPIKAWVLGDCGTAGNNARSVRDAYYNYPGSDETDLMLFLGDNAYNTGTDAEYQFAVFENMYEDKLKNTVAWSCLGNHDGASASSMGQTGPYYEIFSFPKQGESGGVASMTEAYYSFDYGNVHFICLDSYDSDRSVDGPMHLWCESDLQNTSADWIVAFWHHPAYSKGSHNSDTEGRLIDMRENFLPLLESYGVDLVLSGHSHSYERSYFLHGHYGDSDSFDPLLHTVGNAGDGDGRTGGDGAYLKSTGSSEGAAYITGGSSGQISGGGLDHEAMFYSVSELGSCVLDIHGGVLDLKFLNSQGSISDYFTIEKDLDCTVGASCDDCDICTKDDQVNLNCQCVGTPISAAQGALVLDNSDSPLSETYKATQSISVVGNVVNEQNSLTTLIAPLVTLDPSFEVFLNSGFMILQQGCD